MTFYLNQKENLSLRGHNMIIHLSDRDKYKKKDSYSKKMRYTTTIFGGLYDDFLRIKKDKNIRKKKVVWYSK